MIETQKNYYYSAIGFVTVFVAFALSKILPSWPAWFIGGLCSGVPLWYSLPPERRILWKVILFSALAGAASATVVYLLS